MIVFDLQCEDGHRFEGWFASGEEFEAQRGRGLLTCPACGSGAVSRVPSATRYNAGGAEARAPADAARESADAGAAIQLAYSRVVDEILRNTEDVGREFAAEARRIFYREAPERAIRGQATPQEHDALVDEGIPVQRLPVPPPERWN